MGKCCPAKQTETSPFYDFHRPSFIIDSKCLLIYLRFFIVTALKGTADELQAEGFYCHTYLVDIADREQVYEVAKKVKQEVGDVNILINNAGIVACRTLWDLTDKAIESTYAVNILSHYWVRS